MLQNRRYNVNFMKDQRLANLGSKNFTALKGRKTSSPYFIEKLNNIGDNRLETPILKGKQLRYHIRSFYFSSFSL